MGYRRQLVKMAGVAAAIGALSVAVAPASADQIPFTATVNGTLQVTGANSFGPTSASYGGSGQARGMGATTMQGNITVTGGACTNGFSATHTDTLTSSSGDKLVVAITETSCPRPSDPSTFDCSGTYTVTGGTGRFASATGSGTWIGTLRFTSPSGGVFTATYTGVLNVDGAMQ